MECRKLALNRGLCHMADCFPPLADSHLASVCYLHGLAYCLTISFAGEHGREGAEPMLPALASLGIRELSFVTHDVPLVPARKRKNHTWEDWSVMAFRALLCLSISKGTMTSAT